MTNHISKIQCDNAITIARHRIDSGYYDSPAVIDETVRRVQSCIAIDQLAEQDEWDAKNDGERWE